jgi:uncharacterized membrane protein YcfT
VRWIDTARGLAIVLVVSLHTVSWLRETPIRAELWWDINHVFMTMRMPLLFVCSGMLATKWLTAAWVDLLPRKVTFLFWVYLIWQPLVTVMAPIAARVTGDELVPIRLVAGLVLSPVRPRSELWFIWTLAVFFVLARLFVRVPRGPQFAVTAIVSAAWLSNVITDSDINFGWDGTLRYYLFFLIGIHYRGLLQTFAERLRFWPSLLLIGGWLLLSAANHGYGFDQVLGVGLAVRLLGVAAGIALALHLQPFAIFAYLGSRSLPIYLAHPPLLTCFTWLLIVVLGVRSPVVIGVLPPLFTLAAIVISLQLNTALKHHSVGRYLYAPPPTVTAWVRRIVSNPSTENAQARVSSEGRKTLPSPSSTG